MTDDPTTKLCPYKPGDYPCSNKCIGCHGTGRVPLTTGELLSALAKVIRWNGYASLETVLTRDSGGESVVFRVSTQMLDGSDQRFPNIGYSITPDDALRAALRAVTVNGEQPPEANDGVARPRVDFEDFDD